MSSNSDDLFGNLSFLAKFPWIPLSLAIGGGFLIAVCFSAGVSFFVKPGMQKIEQKSAEGFSDPDAQQSLTSVDISTIIKRNIFNIDGTIPQENPDQDLKVNVTSDEPIKTHLPLRLLGTIFSGDPLTGLALVEDTSKKSTSTFLVGDSLGKGKLSEVWREKIIIDFGDHKEYLELEQSTLSMRSRQKKSGIGKQKAESTYADQPPPERYKEEGFERNGGDIVISKDFREKLLTVDFAKVLQDAKAEPNITGGELDGFRLVRIRSESIYEKAGLQNDDIIKEINGVPLTDTAQAIKLLNSLRGEADIEVRLDRGGKAMNMKLQVVQ